MERLKRNRHRSMTLISAPAGYGKTMLASTWLPACDGPSAWVSLDGSANDLQSFASYLLAALHTLFPTLELKTRPLLQAPMLPRQLIEGRPHLFIAEAWLLNIAFRLDELPPILEQVKGMPEKEDPAWSADERHRLSGELAALWSTILFGADHDPPCVDNARYAIEVTRPEHW